MSFQKYWFPYPVTTLMIGIIDLHHYIVFYLVIIFFMVFWWIINIFLYNSKFKIRKFLYNPNLIMETHCIYLEFIWTFLPCVLLVWISLSSLSVLYMVDDISKPIFFIKVIGNQWYWTYEIRNFSKYSLDIFNNIEDSEKYFELSKNFKSSFKIFQSNLISKNFNDPLYLLKVDNRLFIPVNCQIGFIVTSNDVLHSWSIPSFGIKIDACPGRLNFVISDILKPGIYFGQCSELCGSGHSLMPICVQAVSKNEFFNWLNE